MNTFRIIPALVAMFALAGPALGQTVSQTLEFTPTGSGSWTDANNWIEIDANNPQWSWDQGRQSTGQRRLPSISADWTTGDTAYIRSGASVTLNSATDPIFHLYVGGRDIWANGDPNYTDPNFAYVSKPMSTLTIAEGALLIIDPNNTQDTGKGGDTFIGSGTWLRAEASYSGTLNMTGGSFAPCWFRLGEGMGSTGIFNLSGGTIDVRYRLNVGRMGGRTGWQGDTDPNFYGGVSEWGSGYGEVNQTGGTLISSRGSAFEMWIGLNGPITTKYADANGSPVVVNWGGKGIYNLSGGVATCAGKLRIGKYGYWSNPLDPNDPYRTWCPCEGVLNVTGGSFQAGNVECGSTGGKGSCNILAGTFASTQWFELGLTGTGDGNALGQADMRVGVGAVVELGSTLASGYAFRIFDTLNPHLLKMDIDRDGNDVISAFIKVPGTSAGSVWLGTKNTLNVNSIGDANGILSRPRQDDRFTIIDNAGTGTGTGNFATFISNIVNGLDPNYASAFTGEWDDPNGPGCDYIVTFRGFTGGDASGNHHVWEEDLAILESNWLRTGMSWSEGDFTADGIVNEYDLAILNSNWGWIPEPATLSLLGLGGLAVLRRRRRMA
jgi:hypothetical protein